MQTLNVKRLIDDLGGATAVSAAIGCPRTTPYRWINSRYLSSVVIGQLKSAYPKLNVDDYFEEAVTNGHHANRGKHKPRGRRS